MCVKGFCFAERRDLLDARVAQDRLAVAAPSQQNEANVLGHGHHMFDERLDIVTDAALLCGHGSGVDGDAEHGRSLSKVVCRCTRPPNEWEPNSCADWPLLPVVIWDLGCFRIDRQAKTKSPASSASRPRTTATRRASSARITLYRGKNSICPTIFSRRSSRTAASFR